MLDALSEGLTELVEGQRQFAEEFGLPYERVFTTGFEPFKGRDTRAVVREWLGEGSDQVSEVRALLRDLAEHQWALLGAVESLMAEQTAPERESALVRLRRRFLGRSPERGTHSALPRVVAAYARGRETAGRARTHQDNRNTGNHGHDHG